MSSSTDAMHKLDPALPARRGGLVILVFFLLLGGWAAFSSLSSAAIAPGEVAVDSSRKTIQHLEGGIVKAINVRDGDQVTRGQVLIELSDTQARAQQQRFQARRGALVAREARLLAERDAKEQIKFPDSLVALREQAEVEEALRGEENLFQSRNESHASHLAILDQRIAQYQKEIEGLGGEVAAADEQLGYLQDEIDSMEPLVEKKLVGKSRMLELQREAADIGGEKNRDLALIARAKQNIAEQELQILELKSRRSSEITAELRDVQTDLQELNEQMRASSDILTRTAITAPIDGTVVGLQVHTLGGVVGSSEPLMDIVPTDDSLVVNAHISPQDIDVVRSGLPAHVRLLAFNQRDAIPIEGTVSVVSADRLTDERTGLPYYLTKVIFDEGALNRQGELHVQPGMQAEVMIITGERSALSYLLEPITRSLRRSFREQ